MKMNFEFNRLNLLPETPDEEAFTKALVRRIEDSNRLVGWYGDVEIDGKETSGYVITWKPKELVGVAEVK